MGEGLKRCGWRYFNYYPETKSMTDRHDDPHIPLTLVERGYNKLDSGHVVDRKETCQFFTLTHI